MSEESPGPRVFRSKVAKFERITKERVRGWADPLLAEIAIGLARVMDGAVRTDQPGLFVSTADRLDRLMARCAPSVGVSGDGGGGDQDVPAELVGIVGAGPEVRDREDVG